MDIPGKPGKGMYLLQAYHQLHCLVRHFFASTLCILNFVRFSTHVLDLFSFLTTAL
jgi:hypothetical protein